VQVVEKVKVLAVVAKFSGQVVYELYVRLIDWYQISIQWVDKVGEL